MLRKNAVFAEKGADPANKGAGLLSMMGASRTGARTCWLQDLRAGLLDEKPRLASIGLRLFEQGRRLVGRRPSGLGRQPAGLGRMPAELRQGCKTKARAFYAAVGPVELRPTELEAGPAGLRRGPVKLEAGLPG